MTSAQLRPRILFTIGDANGIGIEVLAKALDDESLRSSIDPVIVGNRRIIEQYLTTASLSRTLLDAEHIEIESNAVLRFGEIDADAGRLAYDAITEATRRAIAGDADAIVTMPIAKQALAAAGCDHTAHTELIASMTGGEPLMILLTDGMLVALATIHIPIADVAASITVDRVASHIKALDASLKNDFAIARPRIAVLGLNPHAGEHGVIGSEDDDVIAPAIHSMRDRGIDANGPFPADGFFARYTPNAFDGILAMYHDQGLIPLKMYARGGGVNCTAGLPIVRTSPDHGTGFDIAGRNIAHETSVKEAITIAVRIARNRAM